MTRTDIINFFIRKINAKKYLEIGVSDGMNYNKVICDYIVGVDPNPLISIKNVMTSDSFFLQNYENFDVIFIDGLHISNQVYNDIINSLKFLNPNGVIICHDMNPIRESLQTIPQSETEWTGDCWKAWVKLRNENKNLSMYVVNTDYGCGVIKVGEQNNIHLSDLTWSEFDKNRKEWLNLIDIEDFKKIEIYDK